MAEVYISIGSNQNGEYNIAYALKRLRENFGKLSCSPVYRGAAVGGGADYYNLAVGFNTNVSLAELHQLTRSIEAELGRDRSQTDWVSIDLDILLYGDLVGDIAGCRLPHPDIFRYPHVLKPLADIAEDVVPPSGSSTIGDLLRSLATANDPLEPAGEY